MIDSEGAVLIVEKIINAVAEAEEGDTDHDDGDAVVDVAEGAYAEVVTNLVDDPGDEEPPAHSSADQGSKADYVEPPTLGGCGKEEVGACEKCDEEKDDERIAHRDAETREKVLEDTRGLQSGGHAIGGGVLVLQGGSRIGGPQIEGIKGNGQRTHELQGRFVLFEPIDHQAQEEDRDDGVEEVGERGTQARKEARQASLVQCSLDNKDACRTHRGRHQNSNNEAPQYGEYDCFEHQKRGVWPYFCAKIESFFESSTIISVFFCIFAPQKAFYPLFLLFLRFLIVQYNC